MQARRIGTNELDAIEICHGYVEAQLKYASEDRDKDGMLKYASRLMSTPGRQDGLYWEGASEPLVPEGFAQAAWDGGAERPSQTLPRILFPRFSRGRAPMRRGERTITCQR